MAALRFAVSMFVVVYHMSVVSPWNLNAASPIFYKGWLGTDFFIILSGFIIAIAYKTRLETRHLKPLEFLQGRILRLWPTHAIVLISFFISVQTAELAGIETKDPEFFALSSFLSQLFLANSVLLPEQAWNVPTWTLSALLICYMLYALLVPYISNINTKLSTLLAALSWLIAMVWLVWMLTGKSTASLSEDYALLRAVPLYFFGALLGHHVLVSRSSKKTYPGTVMMIPVIGIFTVAHFWSGPVADTAVILLCALLIILAIDATVGKTLHTLGKLSFAIYLIHVPMIYVYFVLVRRIAHVEKADPLYQALWVVFPFLVVAAAYVFERYIEAPLTKLIKPPKPVLRSS